MRCNECGYENERGSNYCIICGNPIVEIPQSLTNRRRVRRASEGRSGARNSYNRPTRNSEEIPSKFSAYGRFGNIPASLVHRMVAFFIDLMILSVFMFLISSIPPFSMEAFQDETLVSLGALVSLGIQVFYYALFESSSHQGSVGKIVVGIKVVDENGERLTLGVALGRAVCKKFLSELLCCIGYVMAFFTDGSKTLHDIILSTSVVNVKRKRRFRHYR